MRLVRTVAATAVGVALLASCSNGEPANETLPPASSSAAETSESLPPLGPPDMPMPAEAREKTAAGAEAALRYYLTLMTHQAGIGGQPLRDLSRDCDFCDFIAQRYDEDAAAKFSYQGGEVSIDSLSPPALSGDTAEFSFSMTQESIVIVSADGQPVPGRGEGRLAALNTGAVMTWSRESSAWYMNQLIVNS